MIGDHFVQLEPANSKLLTNIQVVQSKHNFGCSTIFFLHIFTVPFSLAFLPWNLVRTVVMVRNGKRPQHIFGQNKRCFREKDGCQFFPPPTWLSHRSQWGHQPEENNNISPFLVLLRTGTPKSSRFFGVRCWCDELAKTWL